MILYDFVLYFFHFVAPSCWLPDWLIDRLLTFLVLDRCRLLNCYLKSTLSKRLCLVHTYCLRQLYLWRMAVLMRNITVYSLWTIYGTVSLELAAACPSNLLLLLLCRKYIIVRRVSSYFVLVSIRIWLRTRARLQMNYAFILPVVCYCRCQLVTSSFTG
jgi:hypothetical protein